ncbi:hypothetical protein ABI59_13825 [Acidobacteria bacterium Mor1]|nr:hypothetical protein ABI59_13825 [Acidobacteria bacterium Mor1]
MRRFYLQIYLGIVGMVLLLVLLALALWDLNPLEDAEERYSLETLRGIGEALSPPLEEGPEALRAALDPVLSRIDLDLTVYGPGGELLAQWGGEALPVPEPESGVDHWQNELSFQRIFAVKLADGRWFVGRPSEPIPEGDFALVVLLVILVGVSVGAYPFARSLTRRLERLRREVDSLAAGDLSARVPIEGKDAIADLARSLNQTASTIESLVQDQRRTLAAASHELRSPLARLRVAVELMSEERRPELLDGARADLKELDELIGEILLASRLEQERWADRFEPVDLLGVAAEEGARVGAEVRGDSVSLSAEPRLVRRVLRNLLENARRHGGEAEVAVHVAGYSGESGRIEVADRGPGVPEADREKIFEPFYRSEGWSEGQGGGVGLGLALVRQIARRHGGDAVCLPRDEGGSRFVVTLRNQDTQPA